MKREYISDKRMIMLLREKREELESKLNEVNSLLETYEAYESYEDTTIGNKRVVYQNTPEFSNKQKVINNQLLKNGYDQSWSWEEKINHVLELKREAYVADIVEMIATIEDIEQTETLKKAITMTSSRLYKKGRLSARNGTRGRYIYSIAPLKRENTIKLHEALRRKK